MNTRLVRILASVTILAGLASACGGGAQAAVDPAANLQIKLPPTLGGLNVSANDEAAETILKEGGKRAYASAASVFELRDGKELRAIFEVIRFTPDARPEDLAFRRQIVSGVGGGARKPERIGETLVYKGRTNQQLFFIWFQDRFLEVLIVREDETIKGQASNVDLPRLLSEILSIKPVTV